MKKFFLLSFAIFLISASAYSQPYPYSLPVTITNGGSAATNVQVLIRINTATYIGATLMKADGGDIRFYDSPGLTTQLGFYIEGYLNTDSTKIWVMMPNLPAGNTTVYCNFGDPVATSASSLSIFDGPHSSIDSITAGNTTALGNCSRGFRFSPNEDLLLTSYGKYEPSGGQRFITLWNFNTQQIVKQSTVTGAATVWVYEPLDQAFWITTGTNYILSIFIPTGGSYYWQVSSQIGQHLTYYDMRYCNNCTENTFPTITLATRQYGYPDFLYYRRNAISPTPTYAVGTLTGITNGNGNIPNKFALSQNYPNPFNPVTKIRYDIPEGSAVKLTVYDMLGREVTQLVNEYKDAGSYEAVWNGINQTSGIYFYRIEAGSFTREMKMILVK